MARPSISVSTRWLLAGLLVGCFLVGCGTPQQRYRILSFFFDGVPNPDAPKSQAGARTSRSGMVIYVHQPYAEKHCENCHQNTEDIFARAQVRPDVCLTCHAKIQYQYPKMHGPVASSMCLVCHSPHQSPEKHLLKLPSPKLCQQCHETSTLNPRTREHTDPKADCLSCHSGHGGEDRKFLKALPTTLPLPATQPAAESKVSP